MFGPIGSPYSPVRTPLIMVRIRRFVHVSWYTADVRSLTRTATAAPGHREDEAAGRPSASRTVKVMELQGPNHDVAVIQVPILMFNKS